MYVQIAPRCRVWLSEKDVEFIKKHSDRPFVNTDLEPLEMETAKILGDKSIFVRKKLDNGVQYALNRRIRFVRDENKK
tara:strand:+ start:3663 stop:3896 length:234 start_codon:yes stop_codon:yes gene_type:complete